jgi:hypothetical protein
MDQLGLTLYQLHQATQLSTELLTFGRGVQALVLLPTEGIWQTGLLILELALPQPHLSKLLL